MRYFNYISISTIVLLMLFFNGCGEDRSQNRNELTQTGEVKKPWIYEVAPGSIMVKNNFIYIPGGFDVDNDGVNESGFWLSKYEAKKTNEDANLSKIDNIISIIVSNFKAYNETTNKFDQNLSIDEYLAIPATKIQKLDVKKTVFTPFGKIYNEVSPLEAIISLQDSQIDNGHYITLPSEKQWMQVVKLIINNPKNWTGKKVGEGKLIDKNGSKEFIIANNILGLDQNVPIDYEQNVTNLAGSVSEWSLGAIDINKRFIGGDFIGKAEYSDLEYAPSWWKPILKNQSIPLTSSFGVGKYHNGFSLNGAIDILEVSINGTGDVDRYAIIARGGSNSKDDKDLVGIAAVKLTYGVGYKGPTVGFRAASKYINQ